jgi:class 3 adenylate cyclase
MFRESGEALQQHGAWAQKYIGDAVMAVWVHRNLVAEVAELAQVFSALQRVRTIADGLQARFDLDAPVRIGAGVNTGPASIGNFGSIAASDHTALGEVVNKAFRLESATKEIGCDLVIGEDTFKLLANLTDAAHYFSASVTKLKGYNEPATVYAAKLTMLDEMLPNLRSKEANTTRLTI